jgi:hypothetical protein
LKRLLLYFAQRLGERVGVVGFQLDCLIPIVEWRLLYFAQRLGERVGGVGFQLVGLMPA